MAKRHMTERLRVTHSRGLEPNDWLRFVEFPYFTRKWHACGLDDEALRALQLMLIAGPETGPVIPGTSGLRKVRFARAGQGKRSGYRIGYAYYEEFGVIWLISVYAKNDKANITDAEKREIKGLLAVIEQLLARE